MPPSFDRRPHVHERDRWSFRVDIEPTDQSLIRSFIGAETVYYNTLVQGLNARLRSAPESLLQMTDPWDEIFAELAATRIHPRDISSANLPDALAKHRSVFLDEAERHKPMDERMTIILELAATAGSFHPLARRALALEMIRFYRQQAQTSIAAVPVSMRDEQTYRSPPEVLEPIELGDKRHVQVPRAAVIVSADKEARTTTFRVPYARKPITVQGGDFSAPAWTLLVLRQGLSVGAPWQLELRKSPTQYLLKLYDFARRRPLGAKYRF